VTDVTIRGLADDDLAAVLVANQAEVPAVGPLDAGRLRSLVALADPVLVAEAGDALAGFVVALPPGTSYGSPNYRWLSERYDDFVYVDRVVVLPAARGAGVGRALYDAVVDRADASVLLAEVNTRPRNDESLAFHAAYGFSEVGRAEPYGDGTEVAYLARPLGGAEAR
jgi:predicted GNAT superfamily acetyltransferase